MIKTFNKYLKWPGIYLFTINLALTSYYFFKPVSVFIPGVLWLIFSLICLELSKYLYKRYGDKISETGAADRHVLNAGYFFVIIFLIRHFMVHIQSGLYIGYFPVRLLIEVFALLAILYWAFTKESDQNDYFSWRKNYDS